MHTFYLEAVGVSKDQKIGANQLTCTLYLKNRNLQIVIYEKVCMNDEKSPVDPCSHHDIFSVLVGDSK